MLYNAALQTNVCSNELVSDLSVEGTFVVIDMAKHRREGPCTFVYFRGSKDPASTLATLSNFLLATLPAIKLSGPWVLNVTTQSRTFCSPTSSIRDSLVREPPI